MASFTGRRQSNDAAPTTSSTAALCDTVRKRSYSKEERARLESTDLDGGAFNAEQQQAIAAMRALCAEDMTPYASGDYPEIVSDNRLLRFLRGHKFDLDTASAMYKQMLQWRLANGVDAIRDEIVRDELQPPQFPHHGRVMRAYPAHKHHGFDEAGRPIHINLIGRLDPKRLLSCCGEAEFMRHHLYEMEHTALLLERLSVERGDLVRVVLVMDLAGLGMGHLKKAGVDLFKRALKVTQDNYPELMHKCLLVNAPKVFTVAWQLLKPLLAERTVNKVAVLSSPKKLIEHIPAAHVPVSLGGARPDEWPLRFNESVKEAVDEEYVSLEVAKGTTETVRVAVPENSFVVWGFFSGGGDVSADLKFTCSGAAAAPGSGQEELEAKDDGARTVHGSEVLVSAEKTEASAGSFHTGPAAAGHLELAFTAASGWMASKKTVHYYVCAVPLQAKRELDSPRNGRLREFWA